MKLIFATQSEHYLYCQDAARRFVFAKGQLPLFQISNYHYLDSKLIKKANRKLLISSDELWVFGKEISSEIFAEIKCNEQLELPMKFYTISPNVEEIKPLTIDDLIMEPELADEISGSEFYYTIKNCCLVGE